MDIEVRKGFDEDSGLACYVAINTVDNPFLQGTGKYTLKQMEYFKMLVRIIIICKLSGLISICLYLYIIFKFC